MFALENRFGNDGYAVWFKLLELLGKTPGHYLDINDPIDFEFIAAYFRISGPETRAILDFLSVLKAIDQKLYQRGIIWSDNFVDGIAQVYLKRKNDPPTKPDLSDVNLISGPENGENGPGNTGTKLDYTKLDKTLCPEPSDSGPEDDDAPLFIFPLKNNNETYPICQNHIDEWTDAFPGLDIMGEVKRCLLWNRKNPAKRKTARGIERHITSWLSGAYKESNKTGRGSDNEQRDRYVDEIYGFGNAETGRGDLKALEH